VSDLSEIWTYLAQQPLLWLTLTLIAYSIGDTAFRSSGRRPYVNPVLIAVLILAGLLWLSATPYQTYFEGAKFVHFMLGPATVSLALPLYKNFDKVRQSAFPLLCALLAGSGTAILSVLGIAYVMGIRGEVLMSLAPKSVTAPVAIGVSEAIGGSPTLSAVFVILTGVLGAIIATPLLNLLGVRDWRARGFAVGIASHGIGTARAFQVNETAGAFAGIGMGLNALLTAIAAPYLVLLFM
jgi:predicted murein hydrolase (TIGR00659 family)